MLTVVSDHDYEVELREASERIARAEVVLSELRQRRDHLIRSAVRSGFSERRAASAAHVSPSYAHRVASRLFRR